MKLEYFFSFRKQESAKKRKRKRKENMGHRIPYGTACNGYKQNNLCGRRNNSGLALYLKLNKKNQYIFK